MPSRLGVDGVSGFCDLHFRGHSVVVVDHSQNIIVSVFGVFRRGWLTYKLYLNSWKFFTMKFLLPLTAIER